MLQFVMDMEGMKTTADKLEQLLHTFEDQNSPEAKQRSEFIFKNLQATRQAIQQGLQMKTDPRHTISAVFRSNSRTGAIVSVSLFKTGKRGRANFSQAGGQSGWNVGPKGVRRRISGRTLRIRSYEGEDRDFIARMLNSGTDVRTGRSDYHGRNSGGTYGRRGSLVTKDAVGRAEPTFKQFARQYVEFLVNQAAKMLNR